MKTTAKAALLLTAAILLPVASALFAQSNDTKPEVQKYRLYIIKDENGNKQIIDKTFTSKSEMDKYIKDNNFEEPEATLAEPPTPATPPAPPAPPVAPKAPSEKHPAKKEKKIIIIEKTEGLNGGTDFELDLSNLSPEDASKVIQEVINMNIAKIEVLHAGNMEQKSIGGAETGSLGEEKGPHAGIEEPANSSANLANLKVYPNPGAQFHVECNVTKPTDVKLRITDMQGREVYEEAMNNVSGKLEKDINAASLGRGIYLMNIEAGSERETTTVVLQ